MPKKKTPKLKISKDTVLNEVLIKEAEKIVQKELKRKIRGN